MVIVFSKTYLEVAELIGVKLLAGIYGHSSINLSFSCSFNLSSSNKNLWL